MLLIVLLRNLGKLIMYRLFEFGSLEEIRICFRFNNVEFFKDVKFYFI